MRDTATAPVLEAVCVALGAVGPGLYVVACSGGADSLALADAAITVAGAAHVVVVAIDHGLQPGAAAVVAGVQAWARGHGAAALVERVVVPRRASLEAAAREARYAALARVGARVGASAILLGHTARDQAETVLLRILRGTGPAGLAGMRTVRGQYVRPFLHLERAAIDSYVADRALPVWADPMNEDPAFTRVRVRATLLPALRAENPQVDAALVRLAAAAGEWLAVIDALATPFATPPVDCAALARQPAAIRKRALARAFGLGDAAQLDALDALVCAPTRGEVGLDLGGGRVVRSYDQLARVAGPRPRDPARHAVATEAIALPGYRVRAWEPGDRMAPARLKGRSKKLSDLFGEARVPLRERAGARVVIRSMDQRIVYVEHLGVAHDPPADLVRFLAESAASFH